jgi:hypothetical protein
VNYYFKCNTVLACSTLHYSLFIKHILIHRLFVYSQLEHLAFLIEQQAQYIEEAVVVADPDSSEQQHHKSKKIAEPYQIECTDFLLACWTHVRDTHRSLSVILQV